MMCRCLTGVGVLFAVIAQVAEPKPGFEVKYAGAMRNVMLKGNLDAHFDCASLRKTKNVYALGPVAGLKGEVTILDGKPSIATIVDGKPSVGDDWPKACFLVYAVVERWTPIKVPETVQTLEHLQTFVAESAKAAKLDVTEPFPFLLTGTPDAVKYHVVWKTDDLPHTKQRHSQAKLPFEIAKREVKMLGFHSDAHHGVFTHHDSNIHIHVTTADSKDSGHVDVIKLAGGMILHLPAP